MGSQRSVKEAIFSENPDPSIHFSSKLKTHSLFFTHWPCWCQSCGGRGAQRPEKRCPESETGMCSLCSERSFCITYAKGRKLLLKCLTSAKAGVFKKMYCTVIINLGLCVCYYRRNTTTFVRKKNNLSAFTLFSLYSYLVCVCL